VTLDGVVEEEEHVEKEVEDMVEIFRTQIKELKEELDTIPLKLRKIEDFVQEKVGVVEGEIEEKYKEVEEMVSEVVKTMQEDKRNFTSERKAIIDRVQANKKVIEVLKEDSKEKMETIKALSGVTA
jgi:uncharacterized protein YoxC